MDEPVVKLLKAMLADTRSWHSHNREVLQLAIDTVELQNKQLAARAEIIKKLKERIVNLEESWDKIKPRI